MVTVESFTPWEQLEQDVRAVTLLGDPSAQPYRTADISLQELQFDDCDVARDDPRKIFKTSLYVARPLLRRARLVAMDIKEQDYDMLALQGSLTLASHDALGMLNPDGTPQQGEPISVKLTPPIVEKYQGKTYALDGSHRLHNGWRGGRHSFLAIVIDNIPDEFPPYADVNDWNEVVEYDEVPTDPALRKRYVKDAKKWYRDFGPLNGSKPRYNLDT
jgi:hypothetical protein